MLGIDDHVAVNMERLVLMECKIYYIIVLMHIHIMPNNVCEKTGIASTSNCHTIQILLKLTKENVLLHIILWHVMNFTLTQQYLKVPH